MPLTESVGSYAFYGCKNLSVLDLPSVKTINAYAFQGVSKLKFMGFSDDLSKVGTGAFSMTFRLDGSDVSATAKNLRGHSFARADGALADA